MHTLKADLVQPIEKAELTDKILNAELTDRILSKGRVDREQAKQGLTGQEREDSVYGKRGENSVPNHVRLVNVERAPPPSVLVPAVALVRRSFVLLVVASCIAFCRRIVICRLWPVALRRVPY